MISPTVPLSNHFININNEKIAFYLTPNFIIDNLEGLTIIYQQ